MSRNEEAEPFATETPRAMPRRPGRPRKQNREPERESPRVGAIQGRNGEQLTRRRVGGIDEFHIPEGIVPPGWTYQWNTVSVYNNPDLTISQSMAMYENGWRPVPASRHPGMFVPIGHKGDIVRGGQRLEERPASLTAEARAEDIAVARRQMTDRDQSLMGGKANVRGAMTNGMEMSAQYRGTGGQLRMSIDPALDVPAPAHKIAIDE